MKKDKKLIFLLCLGAGLAMTLVNAAPKYKIGDTGVLGAGETICFPIKSASKNDWSKFKPAILNQDLRFILHGKVVEKQ